MKAFLFAAVLLQSSMSFASLYNCDSVAKSAAMKAQSKKFNCKEVGCTVEEVKYAGLSSIRGQTTTVKNYKVVINTESGTDLWLVAIDSLNGCNVKSVKYAGEI